MELTDKEFNLIRDYIKLNYGISLADEKRTLIYSRLRALLDKQGFSDFMSYFEYLKADRTGEATTLFINRITTNHTFFMREAEHFEFLKTTCLPWLEQKFEKEKDLRLWCAASSSGEEAYTLQMIMQDYFKNKPGWNLEILATDISEKVLQQASLGIYSVESTSVLPKEWQEKYFRKYDSENLVVKNDIKKLVTFRKFNLMQEKMPFKKPMQIIFCRNVMIYFDNKTREALVKRFYNILEKDGYLFVGHSESLSNIQTDFKYIKPAVYRK